MRYMIFCFFCFLTILGVSACESVPIENLSDKSEIAYNALHNYELGVDIVLGMSKEEVEELLGVGQYLDPDVFTNSEPTIYDEIPTQASYQNFSYGIDEDVIVIAYKNNRVDGATVLDAGQAISNWYARYDLTCGTTIREMYEYYGEKVAVFPEIFGSQGEYEFATFEYYYDEEGNLVEEYIDSACIIMIVIQDNIVCSFGVHNTVQEIPLM